MKLVPPKIEPHTIVQKVVCTRPTRQGCFTIPQLQIGSKQIVHCTGHGGAGWTTLFGYVDKALSYLSKDIPIRILGSGCIGLVSAIELKRRGYPVTGITTSSLTDNASWKAAGYFALITIDSPEEEIQAHEMGVKTFLTYRLIEEGKHPYLKKESVRFLPVFANHQTVTGLEKLTAFKIIPSPQECTLDFGKVKHPHYLQYMTYFMNTSLIMQTLLEEVKRLKIPITIKKITNLDEINENAILDCTGMGSKELFQDSQMSGVRGHLIMIHDTSNLAHTDYMIYTMAGQENLYMFPKSFFVSEDYPKGAPSTVTLGGTFLPGIDELSLEEQKKVDQREFQKMLQRHSLFFYGKEYG